MVFWTRYPNQFDGVLPFSTQYSQRNASGPGKSRSFFSFFPFYVLRFMKFLQLRSFGNRVDRMWSGALGYSVIRDDWKSALQFRKKEKRTRKMPEGFQTTSFPRKRRRIRADLIQAEIDSILSFLYSIKTSKIKIKRGGTVIEQKLSHTYTQPAVGGRLSVACQKRILCEIRQEESRQTNKQTHTRWGLISKEEEATGSGWIVLTNEMGSLRELFRFWGDVGRILHLGR